MYKNENGMAPSRHPNMIWIFADQLRAQALGCNGDPNVFTPNLDMLCRWIEKTGDDFPMPPRP